ncbi:MAG: 6-bladed beta-propeller, partial [Eudoraea sp.]|nr:6-bladed beta-propeller [Eudoraea sp.]
MGKQENKRRSFIRRSATAVLAGTVLPPLSFGNGLTNTPIMHGVVGHGDFRYRVDSKWGVQDPSRVPINDCHEMVLDSSGRIFMTTTGENNNNIIIYDRSGKVLDSWGKEFPGAHGLTITGEGREQFLFITDPNIHKVFKTTLDGKILMTFDRPREVSGYSKDEQFNPTETAIGANGDIYIADGYGENYIIQYNSNGEYIRHFGGKGEGTGEFNCCHGITVDYRDAKNPS